MMRRFFIILCVVILSTGSLIYAEEIIDKQQGEITQNTSEAKKISLDIKGMEIVDILKILSNEGNLNISVGKNVSGKVSLFLKDINAWDAFEIIIATNGLAYEKQGKIVKVMTASDYESANGEKFGDRHKLITRKLKYANAKNVSDLLSQINSPSGKLIIEDRKSVV